MSFELRTDPWCEDCEEFEPRSYTSTTVVNSIVDSDIRKIVRTSIYCRHQSRCQSIYEKARYFAKEENDLDD